MARLFTNRTAQGSAMIAALLALTAAGCAAGSGSERTPKPANATAETAAKLPSPEGPDWIFEEVPAFRGDLAALIPAPGLVMTPEAHLVRGETSCNALNAGYRLDAASGTLRFVNILNNRRLCQRANSEADDAILAAMIATDGFRLSGGKLELLANGVVVAQLAVKHDRGSAGPPAPVR